MGKLVRFVSAQRKADRAVAAEAVELLSQLPEQLLLQLPPAARVAISVASNALHRHARPDTDEGIWSGGFNMLSRVQTKWVWDQIRKLPPEARPNQVRHAFDLVLLYLRQDTGEVMLTRDEIAREIGCHPRHVSTIMGTLEKLHVLSRDRRPEAGYRGRGRVVYVVNAHVAWNGSLELRTHVAAKQKPPVEQQSSLKLVSPEAAE